MKKLLLFASIFATSLAFAQQPPKPLVWINPKNPDAAYLEAAVQKKGTPIEFTTQKAKTAYIANLSEIDSKGTGLRGLYGIGHSALTALSLSVSDAKTGAVVYSYTCTKRGHFYQSAAECLAKHWKKRIEKAGK